MSYRSYIKVGRRAEFEGRYTSRVNPTDGSGSEGGGSPGADGKPGEDGKDGEGVPTGGDAGQILAKIDGTDFNTEWIDPTEGGEAGKESKPFVDWHQFKVIERSSRFDYDPLFDTNPIAQTEWQYQIDLTGAGGFVNIEDIPEGILTSLGWYGSISVTHLRLNKTDDQMGTYPDAMVRFRVFTSLNGVDNEEFSCSLPAWADGECDYESSVSSLASRVEEGEDKQDEVVAAIQQIQVQGAQWALHVDNIDADQITQNQQIESLQNEVEELATQRGAVREYTIKGVSYNVASRDGDLYLNSDQATTLNIISIGIKDNNGNETPPVEAGDIVDIELNGVINRYIVISGNIAALEIEYQSGISTFAVDDVVNAYVYPQNSSSASKEYVDAQDELLQDQIDEKLSLDGANLLAPGTWRIQQEGILRGISNYIVVQDNLLKLYHVQDPTGDEHAVNKRYVDKQTANRTWKYKSGGGNPGEGEFTVSGNSYVRLHHTTHKGMDLDYSAGFNEDFNQGTTGISRMAFTAWRISGGKAQPKFFIWCGWFNDTTNYFELKDLTGTDKVDLGLESGQEYELHFAGFF